jgi:ankyrin repeat protein
VFCQLEYLRQCLRQRIRRALDELPETLDETYDRTLEEIGKRNWEYAHRLFQCVAVASRPLRVEELAEFLAFDFDVESTPTLQEDWREENPAHAVLSTCSSLLAVVDVDGSKVIQFSHFSVKEYLTSKRLGEAVDTISRFHVSMTPAHTIVAQACLGVLLHIDKNVTKEDLKEFPLVKYAAEYWVGHAQFEGVPPNVQDGIKCLFDPRAHHLAVWTWICDPEMGLQDERPEFPSWTGKTPLHYAAFLGLLDIVKFLIVERSQDVNAPGFLNDATPLLIASRQGHCEVVQLLLEHGANTETRAGKGFDWSPLERASSDGHVEIIRLLLEYGANAKALDENTETALHAASVHGQLAAARVLLEHGADANAMSTKGWTPLHYAMGEGIALVLLEHGADTNAKDSDNMTPLHRALERGYAENAHVLLEKGADANARDSQNRTPLHLASERGNIDAVRLLLQLSSDVHARDDGGLTPFQSAAARGHDDVMQLLLEHGAEDHRTSHRAQ